MTDTGASVTIVHPQLVPADCPIIPVPVTLTVKSATQHTLRFAGQARLPFQFQSVHGSVSVMHDCLVTARPYFKGFQGLLGNDFCVKHRVVISPAAGEMQLNGATIALKPVPQACVNVVTLTGINRPTSRVSNLNLGASNHLPLDDARSRTDHPIPAVNQVGNSRIRKRFGEPQALGTPSSSRETQPRASSGCTQSLPQGRGKGNGNLGLGAPQAPGTGRNGRAQPAVSLSRVAGLRQSSIPAGAWQHTTPRAARGKVRSLQIGPQTRAQALVGAKPQRTAVSVGRVVRLGKDGANSDLTRSNDIARTARHNFPRQGRVVAGVTLDSGNRKLSRGKTLAIKSRVRGSVDARPDEYSESSTLRIGSTHLVRVNQETIGNQEGSPRQRRSRGKRLGRIKHTTLLYSIEAGSNVTPELIKDAPLTYQDCLPADSATEGLAEKLKLSHLSMDEKEEILPVILSKEAMFMGPGKKLGRTHLVEHEINLVPGAKPYARPPYRIPMAYQEEFRKTIEKMLDDGVIEHSNSAWSSPIVLVKRTTAEGTKIRYCCDLRRVNAVTIPDKFPLPLIQEQLAQLGGKTRFTTLDLASAYWQVGLKPEHRPITAFATPNGLFQFIVMPFGLVSAPATFQRLINKIMEGQPDAMAYLDDVLIATSGNFTEHVKRVEEVLTRLMKAGLTINPAKCMWGQHEITYLGHKLSRKGVLPCPLKVRAVMEFVPPRNIRGIRQFLGLCSWFRKFIPRFSQVAKPLTELTKKDKPWSWSPACQEAFEKLQEALVSPPVLQFPDPNREFLLFTDSSGYAIGVLLAQESTDGLHPIAYHSRTLTDCETRYSATEREALAIVWGIRQNRYCLLGPRHFRVITDHLPLQFLSKIKEASNPRLARWSLELAEYNFTPVYQAGRVHSAPDALSRLERVADVFEVPIRLRHSELQEASAQSAEVEYTPYWDRATIREEQRMDEDCKKILERLEAGPGPHHQAFAIDLEGLLYKLGDRSNPRDRIVVPQSLKYQILTTHHDPPFAGHLGIKRTISRISRDFFWAGLAKDVDRYCKNCRLCAQFKPDLKKKPALLQSLPKVTEKCETIGLDIVGPCGMTARGNKYIVTMIDHCSRWVEAIPVPNIETETVAKAFVEGVISRKGCPRYLVTDRGGQFMSGLWSDLMKLLKVRHCPTTAYHPAGNGRTERLHHTLLTSLKISLHLAGHDWDEQLPLALLAYRTSPHTSLGGETPAFLELGFDPRLPFPSILTPAHRPMYADDYKEILIQRLRKAFRDLSSAEQRAASARKNQYDRRARPVEIKVGDRVYLRTHVPRHDQPSKWSVLFLGPYRVLERPDYTTFKIREVYGTNEQIVHYNRLKLVDQYEDVITAAERFAYARKRLATAAPVDPTRNMANDDPEDRDNPDDPAQDRISENEINIQPPEEPVPLDPDDNEPMAVIPRSHPMVTRSRSQRTISSPTPFDPRFECPDDQEPQNGISSNGSVLGFATGLESPPTPMPGGPCSPRDPSVSSSSSAPTEYLELANASPPRPTSVQTSVETESIREASPSGGQSGLASPDSAVAEPLRGNGPGVNIRTGPNDDWGVGSESNPVREEVSTPNPADTTTEVRDPTDAPVSGAETSLEPHAPSVAPGVMQTDSFPECPVCIDEISWESTSDPSALEQAGTEVPLGNPMMDPEVAGTENVNTTVSGPNNEVREADTPEPEPRVPGSRFQETVPEPVSRVLRPRSSKVNYRNLHLGIREEDE